MAMDFDFILEKMGKFGKGQIICIAVILYFGIPSGFNSFSPVFAFYAPDYRCKIPEWENCTYESFHDIAKEISPSCDSDLGCNGCKRYNFTASGCSCNDTSCVNASTQAIINCDHGYVYDTSLFSKTAVTEFDLVCGELALQAAAYSLYVLGTLLGGLVFGYICDRIGRWPCLIITVFGCFGAMLGAAISTSYAMYVVFRIFVSFFGYGVTLSRFSFVMEIVGREYRTIVGIGYNMMFTVGYMILSGLSYAWRDWHQLQIACLIISSPFAVAMFFLPESPRWLFSNGKMERPKKICNRLAKINNKIITEEEWQEGEMLGEKIQEELKAKKISERTYSFIDLFRKSGIRLITLGVMFNWFANSFVYYGIGLNTGSLSGSIFVNNAIAGVFELAGLLFCIFTMDRFGRRKILFLMMLVAGIPLLLNSILMQYANGNRAMEIASQICAFIGKMGISGSFGIAYNFTSELFPTVIRSNGIGMASAGARIGGITAPFVIILQEFVPWLPNVIFGIVSLIAAFLALRFPETKGFELLESLEDAELFYNGKRQKSSFIPANYTKRIAPGVENCGFVEEENGTSI